MLIKEFISESNKNRMMTILFKYYKVENTKMKYKTMKDHAHYDFEDGLLLLSKTSTLTSTISLLSSEN